MLARKRPLVVGVFEDQPIEEVNEIADEAGIDLCSSAAANRGATACWRTDRRSMCDGDRDAAAALRTSNRHRDRA